MFPWLAKMKLLLQKDFDGARKMPVLCNSCGEHFLFQKRREAVIRARVKRQLETETQCSNKRPRKSEGVEP